MIGVVLLCFSFGVKAEYDQRYVDSLQQIIQSPTADSIAVMTMLRLSKYLVENRKPFEALPIARAANSKASSMNNRELLKQSIHGLSSAYFYTENLDSSLILSDKLCQLHKADGDTARIIKSLMNNCSTGIRIGDPGLAKQYLDSLLLYHDINDESSKTTAAYYGSLGIIEYKRGNFGMSDGRHQRSLSSEA